MHRILAIIAFMALGIVLVGVVHAAEQQSGTELKFENVDEIRNRPSDIHIGSDPQYRPGMEQQYGGSDDSGYQKPNVEPDKEFIQEKIYYKRVDEKDEGSKPASRWE